MKDRGCPENQGWKDLVFFRTHINHNLDSFQILSGSASLLFSCHLFAFDHLSEQHFSVVGLVTMLAMDFMQVFQSSTSKLGFQAAQASGA